MLRLKLKMSSQALVEVFKSFKSNLKNSYEKGS